MNPYNTEPEIVKAINGLKEKKVCERKR